MDLYALLRLPEDLLSIPYPLFKETFSKYLTILKKMEKEKKIRLQAELHNENVDETIRHGVKHLGAFHAVLPLKFGNKDNIIPKNPMLVYYYHNRLSGHGIEDMISWNQDKLHLAQENSQEPV